MHMDRERGSYVRNRRALENTIEELIDLLDEIDGDPDQEPSEEAEPDQDGEASLGWGAGSQLRLHGEVHDGDAEPSLGSIGSWCGYWDSQTRWAAGCLSDREQDAGDEREHDLDTDEGPEDERELDCDTEEGDGDVDRELDDQDGEGEFRGGALYGADQKAPHDCGGHIAWS